MTGRVVRVFAAAVLTTCLGWSSIACGGPETPDYQSLWTTNTTTGGTPVPTQSGVPLSEYLEGEGVIGDVVRPDTLTDLTVSIPTPAGWESRVDPQDTPNAVMISKGDNYPAAMLVVFKLHGDFDLAEAVKHANFDLPPDFRQLDASTEDYQGFPSAMTQGTYELKGARMHSWRRVVLPATAPPANQRYLVELMITSLADQAVAESNDVEAIISGFTVARK
ncbi:LpqN/LpqT family lipoprotein [Mycobacterium sp.]|uniref:LpqN/LpqT family lipoprotein n=1 Tax=Mycobacterium sp. TaxID=1785 RepID=UPI003A8407BD